MVHLRNAETGEQERTAKYRNWELAEDEEPRPFVDLIQRDPVICDNCFLTRFSRVTKEYWRGSFGWVDFEHWVPYPDNVDEVPNDSASQGTQLVCGNCGYRGIQNRPIPKDDIEDYAWHISHTLDLKHIRHDPEILVTTAEQLNTSENQGRQDSHVFSPAVERAIRVVQE